MIISFKKKTLVFRQYLSQSCIFSLAMQSLKNQHLRKTGVLKICDCYNTLLLFLEYVVFVEWRKGSRLKYCCSVPFHPNKGSKFCNWLRESELVAGTHSHIICVWKYYSLRLLEFGYCKDWAQLLWWWEKQFLLWLIRQLCDTCSWIGILSIWRFSFRFLIINS